MDLLKQALLSVLEVSLSTTVVVSALLLAAPFLRKRYAAKWRYYIWIALAFRLVVPVNFSLPERGIEINIPEAAAVSAVDIPGEGVLAIPQAAKAGERAAGFSVLDCAAVLWLTVSFCIIMVHICSYLHARRKLMKSGRRMEEEAWLLQLFHVERELNIRKRITVIRHRNAAGPMLIGFFRPIIVIPERISGGEEMFFILKHELIHFKRHDTFFQFLFMAAGAIHWFNPMIALMRREAAVDMELSCDEGVIEGVSYGERKAYTETLMATIDKQYGRTNPLTTQFYGGKKVMKRRFRNILSRSRRKRGLFLLAVVACMTFALGMMTGCAAVRTEPSEHPAGQEEKAQDVNDQGLLQGETSVLNEAAEEQDNTPQPENAPGQGESEEARLQDGQMPADEPDSGRMPDLSEDAREIMQVANAFSMAYFGKDQEVIREHLADSYDEDIEVYTDSELTGATGMTVLKGLEEVGTCEIGDTRTVSVEYSRAEMGEGFLYLTLGMVKQEDGWKVDFYGLEM